MSTTADPGPMPGETPAPAPAAPAEKQATVYLVLTKDADKPDWWIVVSTYTARSAKEAISAAIKDKSATAGTFVAVPARSWQPLTLAIETQTKISLT